MGDNRNELTEEMMGKAVGGEGPGLERSPSSVIMKCSNCGAKNEVPALTRRGTTFYCSQCGTQLNNLPPQPFNPGNT